MSNKYVQMGPTADSIPYDDSVCALGADTVQEAIDALCGQGPCSCICSPLMSASFSVIPGYGTILYNNISILTDMNLNELGYMGMGK